MSVPGPETRFVWPPRVVSKDEEAGLVSSPGDDEIPGDEAPSSGRSPSFWNEFESILLGGAVGRWLDGWSPDLSEAACRRCGGVVGRGEADEAGCAACRGRRLEWSRAVRLGVYDGALRGAIVACKYHRDRGAGRAVGALLGERVAGVFEREGVDTSGLLLVPVPTTTRRRLSNGGIDHALLLAREIGRAIGVRPTCLLERRHRPHQAGLSAEARARNIAGTIRLRSGRPMPLAGDVVLVDDVRTTGATATACFRAMFSGERRGSGRRPTNEGDARLWLVTAAVSSWRTASGGAEGAVAPVEGGEKTHQNPGEGT